MILKKRIFGSKRAGYPFLAQKAEINCLKQGRPEYIIGLSILSVILW